MDLEDQLIYHKKNCRMSFHRRCPEFVEIVRRWIEAGNRPPSWWQPDQKGVS